MRRKDYGRVGVPYVIIDEAIGPRSQAHHPAANTPYSIRKCIEVNANYWSVPALNTETVSHT